MRVCSTTQPLNSSTIFSVINPIDPPLLITLIRAHELALLKLHVPLRARPHFFVPPISGQQKRPDLIENLTADLVALEITLVGNKDAGVRRRSKPAQRNAIFV